MEIKTTYDQSQVLKIFLPVLLHIVWEMASSHTSKWNKNKQHH